MSSFHTQTLPLLEGSQNQPHLIPFFPTVHDPSPYPSSYPFSFHTSPEGPYEQDHHHQQEGDGVGFQYGRPSDPALIYLVSLPTATTAEEKFKLPCDDLSKKNSNEESSRDDIASKDEPTKWMSSKMRLMKKMMSSDKVVARKPRRTIQAPSEQPQYSKDDNSSGSSSSCNGAVRVCKDCNTTKTPLWRSGPQGPKSLCNACGIRQRKARKAMAESAATNAGTLPPTKEEAEKGDSEAAVAAIVPYKKRCKFASAGAHDDLALSSSKSSASAFQRVFAQDEKEAAILLMALSCSLKF